MIKKDTSKRASCVKRARELLVDKYQDALLTYIASEHGLEETPLKKLKKSKEFFQMIVDYLMIEDDKMV